MYGSRSRARQEPLRFAVREHVTISELSQALAAVDFNSETECPAENSVLVSGEEVGAALRRVQANFSARGGKARPDRTRIHAVLRLVLAMPMDCTDWVPTVHAASTV